MPRLSKGPDQYQADREYHATPEYRARTRARRATPEYRAKARAYEAIWRIESASVRAEAQARYRASTKGILANERAYQKAARGGA